MHFRLKKYKVSRRRKITLMTIQQIKKIFEDMGIGTEDERRYFTDFAITQAPEPRLFDFIRLDDVSTFETKEDGDAKLAPAS